MANKPGQDLLIQAASGLVAASGKFSETPTAIGAAVVDQHGASLLAMGVLGAYVRRLTTGRGGRVESNLFSAGIDLQTEALTYYLNRKKGPFEPDLDRDHRLASWFHQAPYGIYRMADGFVALSLVSAEQLRDALDDPALDELIELDPFVDRDRFASVVARKIEGMNYADLAPLLEAQAIWFARVATYEDLETNPQIHHNRSFAQIDLADGTTARVVAHPIRYDGEVPGVRRPPPELGADTRDVLKGAGYSAAEIDGLAAREIVLVADDISSEASQDTQRGS
jgi:crotonobetainyl-CoA:carnitine CoA-transferase CaiB-like acyl-CoA transferase